MDSVNPADCRHCGREVVFDGHSMARAKMYGDFYRLPVDFFCLLCSEKHAVSQCDVIEDDRAHKDDGVIKVYIKEN
jgi:hypothetical protein